ncbi:hypothetical protein [Curtobacterium flaccumfaciens]|uniref:hypothetical protein n=1 Tax=Curtobacterium flaccumfaciens TaxID=2035 RepID=UPI001BDE5B7A|nr:hypothetical protein [Curtobacterium flaccumfaciens]MBT1672840.1 hypothetical protein [Curtobacterium flaccumfaciens pv. flaccumfaciens]
MRLELPTKSVDYQLRFRDDLRSSSPEDPEKAVLILTSTSDSEVDRVSFDLGTGGYPVYRIDSERCLELSLETDGGPVLTLDGLAIRPVIIWDRHFSTEGIPDVNHELVDGYNRTMWEGIFEWLQELPALHIASRSTMPSRLGQVVLARKLGLQVPPTFLTNSAKAAAETLAASPENLFFKPAGRHFYQTTPGHAQGAIPRRGLAESAPTEAVPLVFQKYIKHTREFRCFVIENQVVGFEIAKDRPDHLWRDVEVGVARVAVPRGMAEAALAIAEHIQAKICAVEFLVLLDGSFVFLEVNRAGDWTWFEQHAADYTVSESVNDYLKKEFDALP